MQVTAKLNYLRISPRKVRLVADLIRGKRVAEAERVLHFTNKRASQPLRKLLNSAIANAKNNFQLDPDNLQIAKLLVGEGPKLKRWRPRARGQAYEIQKKSSHITMVLKEIEAKAKPRKVAKKKEKPKVVKAPKGEIEGKEIKEKEEAKKEKPRERKEIKVPKVPKGIRRVFRRKAF